MKVKLLPARTKWGKRMEKHIPDNLLQIYAQILVDGIINAKEKNNE